MDRAYLALQLLQAGKNFTFDHRQLRFYLTDVSPDNIVVDDSLKLTFIDLENMVVIHEKTSKKMGEFFCNNLIRYHYRYKYIA